MPRIPRSSFQTSFFHIIVQGINKEYIFEEEKFLVSYNSLLINYEKKYNVKLLAYCIMSNHAHILMYVEKTSEMSKYMMCVNAVFAEFYNKEKERTGYVFKNRFKSEAIHNENYLLNCISYIHNNPVKAKIVKNANEYKYSSYNDYIYKKGIINDEKIELVFQTKKIDLDDFKKMHESARYSYEDYDKESEEIVEEFCNEKEKTLDEIKDSTKLSLELILELKKYKVTNIKIGEILEMGRKMVERKANFAMSQMDKFDHFAPSLMDKEGNNVS